MPRDASPSPWRSASLVSPSLLPNVHGPWEQSRQLPLADVAQPYGKAATAGWPGLAETLSSRFEISLHFLQEILFHLYKQL